MTSGEKDNPSRRALLVGAGRMGGALANGWKRNMRAAGLRSLDIVDPAPSAELLAMVDGRRLRLNPEPRPADVVVLAVKPQGFTAAASGIRSWLSEDTLVMSIMAGVTCERMATALGVSRIVRTMPNTPGAIGKGVTAYSMSKACSADDQKLVEKLLAPLGVVVGPLEESKLDAVTAVSGSGPAYAFLLAEALEAAARTAGLDPETAAILARQTVAGAGALIGEGGNPSDLRKAVTSPGGTTAAALDVLMKPGALPELMRQAVDAALRRSRELSQP